MIFVNIIRNIIEMLKDDPFGLVPLILLLGILYAIIQVLF